MRLFEQSPFMYYRTKSFWLFHTTYLNKRTYLNNNPPLIRLVSSAFIMQICFEKYLHKVLITFILQLFKWNLMTKQSFYGLELRLVTERITGRRNVNYVVSIRVQC